jgi:hypothetical protein
MSRDRIDFDPDRELLEDLLSAAGSTRPTPGKMPVTAKLAPHPAAAMPPFDAAAAWASIGRAAGSAGGPLPDDLRDRFASSLGADLGAVRVHTGTASAEAAAAVGARAYTIGSDIHFAAGTYDPSTPVGQRLIAHEVAHTVQQAGSATQPQYKLDVSTPGDAAEVEADDAADAMVAGVPAHVTATAPALQREPTADPVKTPTSPASGGVSADGKVDGKGAAITVAPSLSIPFKFKMGEGEAKATLTFLGTLDWSKTGSATTPEVPGSPEVSGQKSAGTGQQKSSGREAEFKHDVSLYKAEVEAAVVKETEAHWTEGWEIKDAQLTAKAKAGKGTSTKEGEAADQRSLSVGCDLKVTFKNGGSWTAGVTVLGFKQEEKRIAADPSSASGTFEGPQVSTGASVPVLPFGPVTLKDGTLLQGLVTLSAQVSVKPDWKQIAAEAAKTMAEGGVLGVLEMASTMAVIFAPAVVGAAAFSMIEDETALWKAMVTEQKQAQRAAQVLWSYTVGLDGPVQGPRDATAMVAGSASARHAMASAHLSRAEYIAEWESDGAGRSRLFKQIWTAARSRFGSLVRDQVTEMYENSLSMKTFRRLEDLQAKYRERSDSLWLDG